MSALRHSRSTRSGRVPLAGMYFRDPGRSGLARPSPCWSPEGAGSMIVGSRQTRGCDRERESRSADPHPAPPACGLDRRPSMSTARAVSVNRGCPVDDAPVRMGGYGGGSCNAFGERAIACPTAASLGCDWRTEGCRGGATRGPCGTRIESAPATGGVESNAGRSGQHHGTENDQAPAGNRGQRRIRYTGREASGENICGNRSPHR